MTFEEWQRQNPRVSATPSEQRQLHHLEEYVSQCAHETLVWIVMRLASTMLWVFDLSMIRAEIVSAAFASFNPERPR